jgi:tetratricopeptide (TPR) repeat protein
VAAQDIIDEAYRRHDGGDSAGAVSVLDEALRADPGNAGLLFARGNVRRESGNPQAALGDFEAVLAIAPAHAKAHNNRGITLQALGDLPRARQSLEQALRCDPQFADANFNLGAVLHALGELEPAAACLRRAAHLRPDFADAWLYLGRTLAELGQVREGADAVRQVLAMDPAHAGALNDLGLLELELGNVSGAVRAQEQAVRLSPQRDEYKTNLALSLMQAGELGRAWELFEHRWRADGDFRPAYRYDPALEWRGGPLAGQRLRVWWEQGLGDTLCFSRFVPLVAGRFQPAAISFEVQRGCGSLLSHSLPGIEVFEQGGAGAPYDLHVPLMSLAARWGISPQAVPARTPYLEPTPAALSRWRERLAQLPGLRVGVAWASGIWPTGPGPRHRLRGVDPQLFGRLLAIPGASFISLQVGGSSPPWAGQPGFHDWTGEIASFDDTAALMAGLDLMITVDTSVAHLAGATDVPTWVPLRFEGGNLWAAGEERSVWYPRMRVFRQTRQGDWEGVMLRLEAALRERIEGRIVT